MVCSTMKAGTECAFMTKTGCGYNGGTCHQIVEKCEGCQRTVKFATGKFCTSYPNPSIKWKASASLVHESGLQYRLRSGGLLSPAP